MCWEIKRGSGLSQLVFNVNNRRVGVSDLDASSAFAKNQISIYDKPEQSWSGGDSVGLDQFVRDYERRSHIALPAVENTEGSVENTEGSVENTEGSVENTEGSVENTEGSEGSFVFGSPVKVALRDRKRALKAFIAELQRVTELQRERPDLANILNHRYASGLVDGSLFSFILKGYFLLVAPAVINVVYMPGTSNSEVSVCEDHILFNYATDIEHNEDGSTLDNRLTFAFTYAEGEHHDLLLKIPANYKCKLYQDEVKVDFELPPNLEVLFYSENLFKWLSVMEGYFELSEQSDCANKDQAIARMLFSLIQDKDATQLEPWLEDENLGWFELVSLYSKCLEMPDELAALREMIEQRFTQMLEDGSFDNISEFSDFIGRHKLGSLEDGVSNYVRRLSEMAMRMCEANSEDLTLSMVMKLGSKAYDTNPSFQQSYKKNVFMCIVFIRVALPMMFKWMMSGSKENSQELDEQEQEYGREPSEVVQSALHEASSGGNVLPFHNHNGCRDEAQGANDYLAGLAVVS